MSLFDPIRPRLNESARRGILAPRRLGSIIPKVIYQTYPSRSVPYSIRANIERLKALNPDWRHELLSDTDVCDFIAKEYGPAMLREVERIDPRYGAARIDLLRYLLIYARGGVYLDIKSDATAPLSEVLLTGDKFLLSRWQGCGERQYESWGLHGCLHTVGGAAYQQWHVAAVAGHPFLHAVIERILGNLDLYVPCIHGRGQQGVMALTGQIAYTLAIAPIVHDHPHRLVRSFDDLGLRYSIFDKADQHVAMFKSHHSQLHAPILRPSPSGWLRERLWSGLGKLEASLPGSGPVTGLDEASQQAGA